MLFVLSRRSRRIVVQGMKSVVDLELSGPISTYLCVLLESLILVVQICSHLNRISTCDGRSVGGHSSSRTSLRKTFVASVVRGF